MDSPRLQTSPRVGIRTTLPEYEGEAGIWPMRTWRERWRRWPLTAWWTGSVPVDWRKMAPGPSP